MRVGCIIPTRGHERKDFVANCLRQLDAQTIKPNKIIVVDEKPKNNNPDITYRYRIGVEKIINDVDLIFFIEDDDYYSPSYIDVMIKNWKASGTPEIFGFENTVYYNIFTQKYTILQHAGRASMMNTMITSNSAKKIKWCDDNYSYTDLHLWKQLAGKTAKINAFPCIGIKHGIGMCGGGGHVENWRAYDKQDNNFEFLKKYISIESLNFYRLQYLKKVLKIQKYKLKEKPFLSIITRVMYGKRGCLFDQHRNSIASISGDNYEQIYIIDNTKVGMLNANTSFQLAKKYIEGDYVYLLDDDDFIIDSDFVNKLEKSTEDVVFFKMIIRTGDGDEIYPKNESFGVRQPNRGQIGGSCFIVKKEIYCKYIHYFALPSFGDWNFITEVLKNEEITFTTINEVFAETGRVSHGKE